MDNHREAAYGYSEAEPSRLKNDLQAYLASHKLHDEKTESMTDQREHARLSLTSALTDIGTNQWVAREMIIRYPSLASERPQGEVLYAYYALVKQASDFPNSSVPTNLMEFIEQEANVLEEFSIVVELGMRDIDILTTNERTQGPLEQLAEYANQKRRELESYVTYVTSELYRKYAERVAEFSYYDSESHTTEKELIEGCRSNPEQLRNVIAGDQIRTDQGMSLARLQHDCELVSHHLSSPIDQQNDIKQGLLMTAEGRAAMIAQFEYWLVEQCAYEPEKYKGIFRRDLRTISAKAAAAALYDQYLMESAKGDKTMIKSCLVNYKFLSKQGKEVAKQLTTE